jgi:DNA repair exonuclease SbcCD ATPase subunit
MRLVYRGLVGFVALAALAGCASTGSEPMARPEAVGQLKQVCPADVSQALGYFRRLREMPRPELARELEQRRSAYAADPSPLNRMQLALLLAMPGGPAEDESTAIALLKGHRAEAADEGVRDLCQLIEVLLASTNRREDRLQALQEELKDRRQRVAALERDLKQATTHAKELEQRVVVLQRGLVREHAEVLTLQQQLDELRNIERSLEARRGSALPVRPHDDSEQGQSPPGR